MSEKQQWLEIFVKFIEFLRIDSKESVSQDDRGSKLEMWNSQRMFLEQMCKGLDKGVRTFYVLKARQLGVTTISVAIDIFWLAMHPGTIGCLVSDTEGNRNVFRSMVHRYIDSFPAGFFGSAFTIKKGGDNKDFMLFSNGSRLDFLIAGKRKNATLGEGRGYSFGHLCAAKGTPVVVEDGRVKAIEDVRIGEYVLTHTGARTKVVDSFGQPNDKGPMIKITPWMGHPVLCTKEHTIPTQRGIVEAKDLKKNDLLIMPVRKITSDNKFGHFLPIPREIRGNNQGKAGARAGSAVEINEELGFAMGYYLAEGCMIFSSFKGTPCTINFARHRSETAYALRATEALKKYTTGTKRIVDRKDSLTSHETINGTPLAMWINSHFGARDDKRIPDYVFDWGEDFCRGLLCGILCGDGSKGATQAGSSPREYKNTISAKGKKLGAPRGVANKNRKYPLSYIVMPTTRASLAMQTRDIAASLGYGWASIKYKEAGNHYGRICKPCWRISWGGSAAFTLRELMGLPTIPRSGRDCVNKYKIVDGLVYIKIKNIEHGFEEPEMYDLSVEHDDHTFRTPYFSIGNTEVANYGSPEGLESFKETLSETHPNRLVIYESTAKGRANHWYNMYYEGKRDVQTKRSIFIGWWAKDINSFAKTDPRYEIYGSNPPTEEEKAKIDLVKERYKYQVKRGQLAWYRWRESDQAKSTDDMHQNQPWTEEEAFIMSGSSFFPVRMLQKDLVRITEGDENGPPYVFQGYRYFLGNDFHLGKMEKIYDRERIGEVELRVWEDPVKGAQYVIGVDPAGGRNDWGDSSAISVWRCYADKMVQVAEYAANNITTRQAAWVLAYLAGTYRQCIINIELNGGYGMNIMQELDQLRDRMRSEMYEEAVKKYDLDDFLQAASWYMYHRPDSFGAGYAKGWMSSYNAKNRMCNMMRDNYGANLMEIRSAPLIQEMFNITQEGGTIGADGRNHDDRVFAAMLANMTWVEWLRPKMINEGYTYARVTAQENGETSMQSAIVDRIVSDFLKTQEEKAMERDSRDPWMVERGLA